MVIGGTSVEIKPTLLKYMRNRTAEFYRVLDIYPLTDILATGAGILDQTRDGDKCLLDWLIAVTNDAELVRKHYDELSTEDIMKMLEIFKRVNKITEKENALKNRETTGKVV